MVAIGLYLPMGHWVHEVAPTVLRVFVVGPGAHFRHLYTYSSDGGPEEAVRVTIFTQTDSISIHTIHIKIKAHWKICKGDALCARMGLCACGLVRVRNIVQRALARACVRVRARLYYITHISSCNSNT